MLRKQLLKVASIIGAAGRRCKPVLKKANHCFSLPFLIGELLGEEHGLPQLYYFTAEHFFFVRFIVNSKISARQIEEWSFICL